MRSVAKSQDKTRERSVAKICSTRNHAVAESCATGWRSGDSLPSFSRRTSMRLRPPAPCRVVAHLSGKPTRSVGSWNLYIVDEGDEFFWWKTLACSRCLAPATRRPPGVQDRSRPRVGDRRALRELPPGIRRAPRVAAFSGAPVDRPTRRARPGARRRRRRASGCRSGRTAAASRAASRRWRRSVRR